ncbi:site-specific DNA-methyltransferase [Roseofilum sp. BLCC_M91]|uniref:Methyltransferase n=1 Tax=Roseofilum halophilum BLCC-M91 TaxID=3022259 RepID=A0ABT7BJL1_9CYAN|nr:site-specific DNA-methyltransferase [Roseofilum halophilum]MDJ1179349.1 site-specific DNA-methyltransferase [Roseofilum halophilum BLCC-M91]
MDNLDEIINKILLGDIRSVVDKIPNNILQAVITSPPYFGHRKYSDSLDNKHEIGRENSVELYIENLVSCFKLIQPKLREDGLLWLNLGDTYRNKELQGIPWRMAFALKDTGWILRSDIIWKKPNAMPSSVKNRPTTDHEYIFLFAKSSNYYYNADAIREPHVTFTEKSKMKGGRNHLGKRNGTPEKGKNSGHQNLHNGRWDQAFHPKGRNKRTVWEIPLGKFRDAHFAVYPEALVETCLLASTRKGDIVFDPFTGSGTTGVVALKNQRKFIGCEIVKQYQEMAQHRIDNLVVQPSLFE